MLLRVGVAMMIVSVAAAAVVAVVVALSGPPQEEQTASQAASVEPVSSETTGREKSKFDPGEKLEIDDEPPKERPKQREA
jgi:type II secretory pathway pseudopilin PulG